MGLAELGLASHTWRRTWASRRLLYLASSCWRCEHLQSRPPKGFGARRTKNAFQPRPPKPIFVRRGPIRCPAPRARLRPTGDAPGTPDTTKSEANRRGPDASAARKAKTPSPTFGQATLMASLFSQATQGRVSSCMAAWPSAPELLRATTRCRRCFKTPCSYRRS